MNLEGNNINGEIARKRDIFLQAEKDYLEELRKEPQYADLVKKLNRKDAIYLAEEAFKRIKNIETGNVEESRLEIVETEITLLFAAIEDIERERVRERTLFGKVKEKMAYLKGTKGGNAIRTNNNTTNIDNFDIITKPLRKAENEDKNSKIIEEDELEL